MDFRLDDEQKALVESVRRFAANDIRPVAGPIDLEEQKLDAKLFDAAASLGLPLDAVPAEYEGYLEGSFSNLNRILRDEILGWGCAGIAHQLESGVDLALLLLGADKAAQDRWFPAFVKAGYARAAVLGNRGGIGAREAGGKVVLNGAETAVLLAQSAPFWLVRATGDAGTVIVVADRPDKAELTPVSNTGWRACDVADVKLADVSLAGDSVVARGEAADALWQKFLDGARLSVAARGVGIGQAAVEFARQYAGERIQFDRPIGKFQAIGQMIEENQTGVDAARLLVQQLAARLDAGEKISDDIRKAKNHVARTIIRATIDAVQVLGGYGFVSDYPVEKYFRDARPVEVLYGRDILDILIDQQIA